MPTEIEQLRGALTEARKRLDREYEYASRKEKENPDDKFREGYADGVCEAWNQVVPMIDAALKVTNNK